MSEIDSNTDKKNRIIFKNPDGTYIHCYKSGERDSSSEAKAQANNIENLNNGQSAAVILTSNMNGNNTLGNNFLYLSDDELRNLIDTTANDEYPALIGHLLDIFRRYRIIFTCSTLVEMFLSFGLTFITWEKRETAITVMADIYPEINSREAAISFYILFFTTLALNIVYYPFGYYALARKSVRLMRVFSFFILFNAMFILLSINIDMLLLYGFSRFLCNLLVALLMMPIPRRYNNYNSL